MFGCCVRKTMKWVMVAMMSPLLLSSFAQAQNQARPASSSSSQKAVIVAEEGTVFDSPDFDGNVIATLPEGAEVVISIKKRGAFHRVRVKPGQMGWISDAEVEVRGGRPSAAARNERKEKPKPSEDEESEEFDSVLGSAKSKTAKRPVRPIEERRYLGPTFEVVQYAEDTMGAVRRSSMSMFGLRWSGPNTMMSGLISMDSQLLFSSGAPAHYEAATNQPASGFMMLGSTIFMTEIPTSENTMAFYGFGPMFRLNKFEATLLNDPSPGQKRTYSLEDLTIGAVLQLGVVVGFSPVALRLDGRYYWETQQYTSFSLGLQWEL